MAARLLSNNGRGVFFGTAALFSLALTLGGLGPHAPVLVALIEAAAFPLLVALALSVRPRELERAECVAPLLFVLAIMLLGLVQLVPLPASIWRALPGRDVPTIVLDVLGQADRARPLSLAPEDTRLVIQSWLPPITLFIATMIATRDERVWLARLVVVAAALSSVLALLQLSFGDGTLFLDPGGISNRYPGLFANYNHQGAFLAAAVALLPAVTHDVRHRSGAWRWWQPAFWALALVGTLITSSRSALALFALSSLVLVVPTSVSRGSAKRRVDPGRLRIAALFVAAAAAAGATVWLATGGYRAELMAARFGDAGADLRYEFWGTSVTAARSVFPFGAGFGTFESVYQLVEPLDQVRTYLVNHAHNDYLEIVIEAGFGGILVVVAFGFWLISRLVALIRSGAPRDRLAVSGATIVGLVMLHSLVDYPLRTEAIGCVFAFACALLIAPPSESSRGARVRTLVGPAGSVA